MEIYKKLKEYGQSDYYPMHMPGHKRKSIGIDLPYDIDITEIEGFDNLYDAKGIINEAQKRAAALYNVKKTFFLINGSTGGILSAISACSKTEDTILVARNSHKSAYNAAMICGLNLDYIFPKTVKSLGISGSVQAEDVNESMENNPNVKTVFITSPTYEGVVSDIEEIAKVVHNNGGILIVDEAHGAHLGFLEAFPESAVHCGADIVIQSAHKTLPALTQSAFLHVCSDRVNVEKLKLYLSAYQSSSPSYILMTGLDACVRFLEKDVNKLFVDYSNNILKIRSELRKLKKLKLLDLYIDKEAYSKEEIFAYDPGKIVILCEKTTYSGVQLSSILREKYHIECEMAGVSHVIAMTSIMDTQEGLNRLADALKEIDKIAEIKNARKEVDSLNVDKVISRMSIREAVDAEQEAVKLDESLGRTSGEYIFVYPPGSPLITPGEEITIEILRKCRLFKALGLEVCGAEELDDDLIKVVIC